MSKRKKNKVSQSEKAAQAQVEIANSRKPKLKLEDLPSWLQGLALTRFKWIQWVAFIPLVIVAIAAPMLQGYVPSGLSDSAGMVNKNVLFLVPFCCLLVAWFCWISIRTRRKVDHVYGNVERFALMEMETFIGEIIVILICTVTSLWQVFVAFH